MTWMAERPTQPGWYYYRSSTSSTYITMLQVVESGGCLKVVGVDDELVDIEGHPGQWAERLTPPEG